MKKLLIISVFLSILGCKTKTVYIPVKESHISIETVRDTLVEIRLKPHRDSISITDTLSYLSNTYAYSWAKYSNGKLNHSLGILDVPVTVKVHYVERSTIDSISVPYPVIETVEVNKLKNWQAFLIWCGVIGIGGISLSLFSKLK